MRKSDSPETRRSGQPTPTPTNDSRQSRKSESEQGFVLHERSALLDWLKSEQKNGNLDGVTDIQIRPPSDEWIEALKRKRGLK